MKKEGLWAEETEAAPTSRAGAVGASAGQDTEVTATVTVRAAVVPGTATGAGSAGRNTEKSAGRSVARSGRNAGRSVEKNASRRESSAGRNVSRSESKSVERIVEKNQVASLKLARR
jgi:hypothetical protein